MLHLFQNLLKGKLMKLWVDIKISVLLIFNLCFTRKTQTVTALGFRHKLFRFLLLQTIERPDYSVEKIIPAF
jgi:hypothetical protein